MRPYGRRLAARLRWRWWVLCLAGAAGLQAPAAADFAFEERVAAQREIEEVYWRHRIWPAENAGAKPPLSAVMDDDAIRARVEDYLKKSNALEAFWRRPVTAEQLQAELDRITRSTRDPEMLRELFEALDDDAVLIAETLARQTLVDRLIRGWYAYDDRFHGEIEGRAKADLARFAGGAPLSTLSGEYREFTYRLVDVERGDARLDLGTGVVPLSRGEWDGRLRELAVRFGAKEIADVAVGRATALEEDAERFGFSALLARPSEEVTIAAVTWEKPSFDSWWDQESAGLSVKVRVEGPSPALLAPTAGGCESDTWSVKYYAPGRRSGHTAVWTGTEMIIWGGVGSARSGARYDPLTDTWRAMSNGPDLPAGSSGHTAVWTGTEMIVWGGAVGPSPVNAGGRYDPLSDTWVATSTGAGVPSPREEHSAVWTGAEMIVWGGHDGNSQNAVNTGARYDPVTDTWTETSVGLNVPSARSEHAAVWAGTEMIVWGGSGAGTDTGGRYDPTTDAWASMVPAPPGVPGASDKPTTIWTGSEMMVWEGSGGRYDPSTDTWTVMASSSQLNLGSYYHTAVWTGSEMIVWGGGETDIGGRYDPASDSWTATSPGPSPRWDHSAVWTGMEMIIWGGEGEYGDDPLQHNTGGRYSPLTDSWVPTATRPPGVPLERDGHTAVWTGAEMIVWGGTSEPYWAHLKTGGRYDPAIDSWTSTSTSGAPDGRRSHTAVWTGDSMVVWGGWGDIDSQTGGRYHPALDAWEPTSTGTGVPSGRWSHTAVWTGTEMIVWGGDTTGNDTTGGLYDPLADSWTPTSTLGAPPSGSGQAVWTGDEMIVWSDSSEPAGRYDPESDSWTAAAVPGFALGFSPPVWTGSEMVIWDGSVGGRYDAASDSWTATASAAGVVADRDGHSAVWTGEEMIVWGGRFPGGFVYTNTGGRYDPVTDSWTPTSIGEGVPGVRRYHTSVWTGTEMIVWGGRPFTTEVGLYCTAGCPVPRTIWRDFDGDGFGGASEQADGWTCTLPDGWVDNGDDCDDGSASTFPGAAETCNAIDDNCNDLTDEDSNGEDGDGDGVHNLCDNCVDFPNPGQANGDGDGTGDACTPSLLSIDLTPNVLWPPNHRMVPIDAGVIATAPSGPPTVALVSITSSEPDDAEGKADGSTLDDVVITNPGFQLRAERAGGGVGRTYTVTYSATTTNGSNLTTTSSAIVLVPHDQNGVTEPLGLFLAEEASGTVTQWAGVQGAQSYNVIRGRLGDIRNLESSYELGAVTCIEAGSGNETTVGDEDPEQPDPGEAFFYLVEYDDGLPSSYGTESAAKPRLPTSGGCL